MKTTLTYTRVSTDEQIMKRIWLSKIHERAVKKDWDGVREILQMKIFTYREAQLFCERFKGDYEASKFILKQATCSLCGGVVTEWKFRSKLLCGSCTFSKAMQKIEYGK